MRTGTALLAILLLLLTWTPVWAEEAAACMSGNQVSDLVAGKIVVDDRVVRTDLHVWDYARVYRSLVESASCVRQDRGNAGTPIVGQNWRVFYYRLPSDPDETKLEFVGTEKYGHWYLINGKGIGREQQYPPAGPRLWVGIDLSPTQALVLDKFVPPVQVEGGTSNRWTYMVNQVTRRSDGKWYAEAWVAFYGSYPSRLSDGTATTEVIYSIRTAEQSRAFGRQYVPVLLDFIEAGYFDGIRAK